MDSISILKIILQEVKNLKLDTKVINNFLNQDTNSGDSRKIRILSNIPSIMNQFLKPHNPSLTNEERFINCLLNWRNEVLISMNNDTTIISDAIENLNEFFYLLFDLSKNPDDKELLKQAVDFNITKYITLCCFCGTENVSKVLKRVKNFRAITKSYLDDRFKKYDYELEIKRQIKHFTFIHNKFIGFQDSLVDIPIILALFDVRPK